MAQKDERGRAGEERATRHLRAQGYQVIDRNWRCAEGEIDIVAARNGDVVVVEVKTRRSDGFGHPFEAVDGRKRDRLWRLSRAWLRAHPHLAPRRVRIDLIGITGEDPATAVLEHLEDLA